MPAMKLKVSAVTTSQAPQTTSPARTRSVRACRRVNQSPATSSTSEAGSSHATWPPISESNSRRMPVAPQPPPPPGPPPPPTEPVSSPVSRPKPL